MQNVDWTHCHMKGCTTHATPVLVRPGVADNQPICLMCAAAECKQNPVRY